MINEHNRITKFPDNSKAGITVCFNHNNGDGPFEATVYFKKSGTNAEDLRKEDAIVLTASGKLRLDIGKNGFVEIFAENSNKLKDAEPDGEADSIKEGINVLDES
jgi:hypothetical protein